MKKIVTLTLVLAFTMSVLLFLSGCGAIIPFIASILSSKAGFLFIPLLKASAITANEGEKLPGMILLFENNPPEGYGPLSGAKVTIAGVTGFTDENGYFLLEEIPVGIQILRAEHPDYVSLQQEVVVDSPEAPTTSLSNFRIVDDDLLLSLRTGSTQLPQASFHFEAAADDAEGLTYKPDVSWIVNSPDATIDSEGIFQTEKDGTYTITATTSSGMTSSQGLNASDTVNVRVENDIITIFGTVTYSNGQPLSNAYVSVENNNYFAVTDGYGNYELNGVPDTSPLTVIATSRQWCFWSNCCN